MQFLLTKKEELVYISGWAIATMHASTLSACGRAWQVWSGPRSGPTVWFDGGLNEAAMLLGTISVPFQ